MKAIKLLITMLLLANLSCASIAIGVVTHAAGEVIKHEIKKQKEKKEQDKSDQSQDQQ